MRKIFNPDAGGQEKFRERKAPAVKPALFNSILKGSCPRFLETGQPVEQELDSCFIRPFFGHARNNASVGQ